MGVIPAVSLDAALAYADPAAPDLLPALLLAALVLMGLHWPGNDRGRGATRPARYGRGLAELFFGRFGPSPAAALLPRLPVPAPQTRMPRPAVAPAAAGYSLLRAPPGTRPARPPASPPSRAG